MSKLEMLGVTVFSMACGAAGGIIAPVALEEIAPHPIRLPAVVTFTAPFEAEARFHARIGRQLVECTLAVNTARKYSSLAC
jgi:hypothetical protein